MFNGIFTEIIRENVNIPKSEIELELDAKRAEQQEKLKNLEEANVETEKDKHLKSKIEKRNLHFPGFVKEFGLPAHTTMDKLFVEVPEAMGAFDTYVENMENEHEEEAADFGLDESGDGPE